MKEKRKNIVLIGMSGAGKSTLGVLLAKALGMHFCDTDIVIQQTDGRLLQQIIDADGTERFLEIEENAICSLTLANCIIATGGSAVYSQKAMRHLKRDGVCVYLKVDFESLAGRLSNITTRGIVFKGKSDLRSVYTERLPLYEAYADLCVDCTARDVESSVGEIIRNLREMEVL